MLNSFRDIELAHLEMFVHKHCITEWVNQLATVSGVFIEDSKSDQCFNFGEFTLSHNRVTRLRRFWQYGI